MAFRGDLVTLPGFAGPSNRLSSVNADDEQTINLYPESTPPGSGKVPIYLKSTPCAQIFANGVDGTTRGTFQQDGRAFAVFGEDFTEIFANGTIAIYGTVEDDDLPVSMASNGTAGNQLLVIAAGHGYILDTIGNTFAEITDPDFPVRDSSSLGAFMCWFMDGYFGVMVEGTRRFQISALEDGTSWDALDVAERSEGSDNIIATLRSHREIWQLGSQTTEVWYDNGDPLFPFAPIQGVFVEHGCKAPWSTHRVENTICWIGVDERGQGVVYRANGYTPERISTYAVELSLQTSLSLDDARGFAYQQDGHVFSWFFVPDLDKAWVYDWTEGRWHQRALWNTVTAEWTPYRASCHMLAFNEHLVGDPYVPALYTLKTDRYADEVVVLP